MNIFLSVIVSLLIFISIIVRLYYLYNTYGYGNKTTKEGFNGLGNQRCPNILVQKGTHFFLYNSKIAKVPGVNPVQFNNLEEYTEFIDWQRNQGIRCPILFLQHSYDAQGNPVYKVRPSPNDLQGGLPPSVPYPNPSPEIINQQTAILTPEQQDSIKNTMTQQDENLLFSANPMDDNWGGQKYTQALVDKGVYAGNEVKLRV